MTKKPVLNIYSEDFYFWQKIRNGIKGLLGRHQRGPQAVLASLLRGFDELKVNYRLNQKPQQPVQTACVTSGVNTLRWALAQKSKGFINKIIAGPNLVVTPDDESGILKNPLIDKIIVPCDWVRDFYLSVAPVLAGKIQTWPAGVKAPPPANKPKQLDFLIYNKIKTNLLLDQICSHLQANHHAYKIVEYGKFNQQEYFSLLERARYLIYLSESESQGLAMMEAWARNVPTLVWERGFWEYNHHRWEGLTASPYLDPRAGMRFKDFQEFEAILPKFLQADYAPRDFALQNFSDKVCAQKFLKIVNSG